VQIINVGTTIPAAQLISAGQGTTLIANNDPAFTLWIGDTFAINASSTGGSTSAIPLSAGSTVVVDGKSDVFAIADPSATNSIQVILIEGGLSFFQPFTELIVQGSTARVLIYSGIAMLGTLIGSWAAVAGVDIYGNAYPAGLNVVTQAIVNNATIVNAAIGNAIINASSLNQGSVFESTITFDTAGGGLFMYSTTTTTVTLAALTPNWTAPAGNYTSGYVKLWGSGASGNGGVVGNYSGSGNGGGGYAENSQYPLTPGTVYQTVIPQGGLGVGTGNTGRTGGTCTFDTTNLTGPGVSATGGSVTSGSPGGGPGGLFVTGTVGFNGGKGGYTSFHPSSLSGGGGAAGGPGGQGGDGGQDGPAGISHGGGNGGEGAAENANGGHGAVPGGGGAGAGYAPSGSNTSGPGGDARITITYNTGVVTLMGAASPVAGTDASGNAFSAGFTGQIVAFHPGSSPAVVETPQTVTLDSGWTNVNAIRYWLTPENTVKMFGSITHAAFTTGTNINSSNLLPSGYRPSKTWNIGGVGIPGRAAAEVTATGLLVAEPGTASCTECDIGGEYPLGI
jgi:hypothetical protein